MFGYEQDVSIRDRYDAILDHLDAMYTEMSEDLGTSEGQIQRLESELDNCTSKNTELHIILDHKDKALNTAYTQRAIAAIAFAHTVISLGGTAGVGKDDREDEPDEWRVVLYVNTPAGQMSWHIAPNDQPMLEGLPQYQGSWDGLWNSADVEFYKEFAKCRAT